MDTRRMVDMATRYIEYTYDPYRMGMEYDDRWLSPLSSTGTSPMKKKADKSELISAVRNLNQTSNELPDVSDEFIMRFLNARKMNADASFQLMTNYFKYRKTYSSIFTNLTAKDPLIQLAFRDGLPLIVKNKDRRGRSVILFLAYQWDHARYSFETIYRALVLSMEYLLKNVDNQINGFVFVVDWSNVKLRDTVDLTPRVVKLMIEGFQDSFPAKIKAIHFVGQPWYVDGILMLVKSFLKEKTKNKLIMHGTNLSTLHEYLHPDVLPTELGGEGPTYSPIEWIDLLCQ